MILAILEKSMPLRTRKRRQHHPSHFGVATALCSRSVTGEIKFKDLLKGIYEDADAYSGSTRQQHHSPRLARMPCTPLLACRHLRLHFALILFSFLILKYLRSQ